MDLIPVSIFCAASYSYSVFPLTTLLIAHFILIVLSLFAISAAAYHHKPFKLFKGKHNKLGPLFPHILKEF